MWRSNGLTVRTHEGRSDVLDDRCRRWQPSRQQGLVINRLLDVRPRIIMQILRHAQFAVTMEIYAKASSPATRDALRRLGDSLRSRPDDDGQATGDVAVPA